MAIASSFETGIRFGFRKDKLEINSEVLRAPKDVMKAGPVLIEGKGGQVRNQWDLFIEYCEKARFFVTGEFYGERSAAMVDPEVKSRQGNAKSKTGEFRDPRTLFREAALLSANLIFFDEGIISIEELTRQYDGLFLNGQGNVQQLRNYLAILFGRIKYRDLERRDAIQKREEARPKHVLIPETSEHGVLDSRRFLVGTWADLNRQQIVVQNAEAKRKGKKIKVIGVCGALTVFASACTPVAMEIIKTVTPERPPINPNTQAIRRTATPEATATTEAPQMTATPTYHVEAAGGEYSPAQEAMNNSASAMEQKARIQRWLDYWVNFKNRPFAPDTTEIQWKYLYDNPNNPTKVAVIIEVYGEYGGKNFTVPIGSGVFAEFPPEVNGDNIREGFGPLELTAGEEGQWLSVDGSDFLVRRDGSGKVVEKLNMDTRKWEKVGMDMEKFNKAPESYEYLLAHPDEFIKSPDPLVEKEAFDKWYNDEFIPALGPLEERKVNYPVPNNSDAIFGYQASGYPPVKPNQNNVKFFYFKHEGHTYPVVVFNFSDRVHPPDQTTMTAAVILNDEAPSSRANENALKCIADGDSLISASIYYKIDIEGYFKGVDMGKLPDLTKKLGEKYSDGKNEVRFGFGTVRLESNY